MIKYEISSGREFSQALKDIATIAQRENQPAKTSSNSIQIKMSYNKNQDDFSIFIGDSLSCTTYEHLDTLFSLYIEEALKLSPWPEILGKIQPSSNTPEFPAWDKWLI